MQTPSPTYWIDQAVHKRYRNARLSTFEISNASQAAAVDSCRSYIEQFKVHLSEGESLMLIGPKGTGKDHLMIAVCKAICERYRRPDGRMPPEVAGNARFVDGVTTLDRLRDATFDRAIQSESSGH